MSQSDRSLFPDDRRHRSEMIPEPIDEQNFLASPPIVFSPRVYYWSLFLFLATCVSTFYMGMFMADVGHLGRPLQWGDLVSSGFAYSLSVMGILLFHELGHYLQARRYGVPATPPFFIPMPLISPFGTMGAVILQSAGQANRKVLFDIAITGPLAGLVLAIPICWFGALQSQVGPVPQNLPPGSVYGDPLLMQWMFDAIHGPRPAGQEILLNPLLFAGWVGIFITALNLLPLGQLDGGHILYALIGKRAHIVATMLLCGAVAYMFWADYWVFSPLLILITLMGIHHPPSSDDSVPLGWPRVILGWLTLAFLVIGMSPKPIQ